MELFFSRTQMKTSNQRPWARQLSTGLASLFGGGAALATAALGVVDRGRPEIAAAGVALSALGCVLLASVQRRWAGKRVERVALESLKLPPNWEARANVPLPRGGGDIDLVIGSPHGERYAVEIKALRDVRLKRSWFGFVPSRLVTRGGDRLKVDPLEQTIRNAEAYQRATPVLWLPKASGRSTLLETGVWVVFGGTKSLKRAIGCPTGWTLW
jgi:hypothetical protein